MEYRGIKENINPSANTPTLHHSSTTVLQYSEFYEFKSPMMDFTLLGYRTDIN